MKKRIFCLLLASVLFFGIAAGERLVSGEDAPLQTTPFPEVTDFSVKVSVAGVSADGSALLLSPVLRYSRNGSVLGDGIVLMSDRQYAEQPMFGAIMEATLFDTLVYETIVVDPDVAIDVKTTLYCPDWTPAEYEDISPDVLETGRYLLVFNISQSKGGNYCVSAAYLWLFIASR